MFVVIIIVAGCDSVRSPDTLTDPCLFSLLVRTIQPLNMSSLSDGQSIVYSGNCLYILIYMYYISHLTCLCNDLFGLSALVGCLSLVYIRWIIYMFLLCILLITQLLRFYGRLGSRKAV